MKSPEEIRYERDKTIDADRLKKKLMMRNFSNPRGNVTNRTFMNKRGSVDEERQPSMLTKR